MQELTRISGGKKDFSCSPIRVQVSLEHFFESLWMRLLNSATIEAFAVLFFMRRFEKYSSRREGFFSDESTVYDTLLLEFECIELLSTRMKVAKIIQQNPSSLKNIRRYFIENFQLFSTFKIKNFK